MPKSKAARAQQSPIKKALMLPVVLALLIVALPFLIPGAIKGMFLRIRFWQIARREGKSVLLVYSNNPKWKLFFEQNIIPPAGDHAIVLNLSDQVHWNKKSWPVQVFRHWGGTREFNPLAIMSCGPLRIQVFRFYRAFRAYKKGNPVPLQEVERRFLQALATTEHA